MITRIIMLSSLMLLTLLPINAQNNTELSDAEKIFGLSVLWKEASYNFAHFEFVPELDWDKTYQEYIPKVLSLKTNEEYYNTLKEFYALLHHHHTFFLTPMEMNGEYDEPNIKIVNIQRQAIIENVGISLESDIPIGSRIIEVDDIPVNEFLKKNKFPYINFSREDFLWEVGIIELLKGKKGTNVKITYNTPDKVTKDILLIRNSKESNENWVRSENEKKSFEFQWFENNIAYLALNTFNDEDVTKDFNKILPELQKCKAIIIDLRKNGGGDSDIGYEILKHFIEEPISTYTWKTRENIALYKAWGRWTSELSPEALKNISEERKEYINHYKNLAFYEGNPDTIFPASNNKIIVPMVVLIGNTGSAAEDFLVAMDNIKNVVLVGKTTAGCTGTPYIFDLPVGGIAFVTTTIQMYPDGRKNREGVQPDVEIKPTIEDIIENRDPVLEKGIEILTGKIN